MAPKAKPAAAPTSESKAKDKAAAKKKVEKKQDDAPQIERKEQPDRAAYDEKMKGIQDAISDLQKQQSELTKKIQERSSGKEEFYQKKAELRALLDDYSEKMSALQAQKEEINKAVGNKKQEAGEMKQQLTKMKKSIGYTSEGDIDKRIADIQFKMWTDTVPLKEEKKMLAEIQELKRNRGKVGKLAEMETKLEGFDTGSSMREKISVINEELSKWYEAKKQVQEKIQELNQARQEQTGDIKEIFDQRDALNAQVQEKIKERNAARDEFNAAMKEFRAYLEEVRAVKQEKFLEDRKKRQAEQDMARRQYAADKLNEQPHVSEMTLVEQTILFCKNLLQSKDTQKKEEKKEEKLESPDGCELLVKKEDRDEFYFVPTKQGKKGKANKKSGKSEGSSKPIKHNAETFQLFVQVGLDAPISTDDIPSTLEKLEEKLADYKEKVRIWEEKRDEMKRRILEDGILPGEEEEESQENTEKKTEGGEDKEEEDGKEDKDDKEDAAED